MDVKGGSFESLSNIQPSIRRLDPFWATRLWQRLIREALMTVRVCRQRHFLKCYDDVFNGEDLVDSVLQFLKGCKSELDVERIDRPNALKVCQILMEKNLFESVTPKSNQKFEDGSNKLYRFVPDQTTGENDFKEINIEKENYSLKSMVIEDEKENIGSPKRVSFTRLSLDSSPLTPNITRCAPFGIRHSLRLKTPLLRVRDTKPSPVRFSKRRCCDPEQEAAVLSQREKSLALLLQLIEVPLLENILAISYDLPELPGAPQPFILENDFTPRKPRTTKLHIRGLLTGIPSLKAALLCLDNKHPEGITDVRTVHDCKVLCYKSVVERFSWSPESLIPGQYFSIYVAIVQMLKNEQRERALNAMQLLMIHLPWKRRDQARHLLQYLYFVVNDIFVSVDKKVTNYEAIKRDFSFVVLRHPLLAEESQKILFDYLLLESAAIFKTSVLEKIKETDTTFCEKINVENMEGAASQYTNQCLFDLASFIIDSTSIKLAEKKVWLKKLKKTHPSTYKDCNFDE